MTPATLQARPVTAFPVDWAFPAFTRTMLHGGLELLHLDLPGRGIVSAQLLLDGPVTVEPAGLEGVATITARALSQGTARRDAEAFATALDRAGARFNAAAGTSAMSVSVSAPASQFCDALALLAEAVTEPTFPAREVDRLVRERLDEIRRDLADPGERASMALRAALVGPGHRLHLPNGGTAETVAPIERDAVAAFHTGDLAGRRATLVVAGDLTGIDLPVAAAAAFGAWPRRHSERLPAVPLRAPLGPRVVVVDRPGAAQTQLAVGLLGPDRHARDWADLRVAAYTLGGTLTSRLDAVLREEKGYTYGMRALVRSFRSGGVVSLARGSVATNVTEPALLETFCIAGALGVGGVSQEERDAAVRYLVDGQSLRLETAAAVVATVADNLAHDLPAEDTTRELAELRAVTTTSATTAAATHVRIDDAVIAAVGDASEIVAGLERLGHAPVDLVDDRYEPA